MNHPILKDIFETAATLPNKEGVAAIEQLLIEACSQFEGVEPDGFSYSSSPSRLEPAQYYLTAKTPHPISKIPKLFTGMGITPKLAYKDLEGELNDWFAANPATTTPDLRTESIN